MIPFLIASLIFIGSGKHYDRHKDRGDNYECCYYNSEYSRKQREIEALEEQVKELKEERRERREREYRRKLRDRGDDE